jgi:hypothetical protein
MTRPLHSAPRIFISHSSRDSDFGRKLAQDLRSALGNENAVWYDVSGGLQGGQAWWRKIIKEVKERNVFLVILSPDAMESPWVNDEIDLAWRQKNSLAGKLIIPVLYRECDIRDDMKTRQIISFLPPKPYELAFNELLTALGVTSAASLVNTPPLSLPLVPFQVTSTSFVKTELLSKLKQSPFLRGNNVGRVVLSVVLLLLVALGTAGLLAFLGSGGKTVGVASGATGIVSFRDSQNGAGQTDTLTITISGLNAAPSNSHYSAWLINTTDEKILPLGKLIAEGRIFSLGFTNGGNRNLLGEGDRIEITMEQGDVTLPTGTVVFAANFPSHASDNAFIHIKHLLYSFPTTPGKIGLLVGLRDQTKLLNAQAVLLRNAVSSHNTEALKCAAQSLIDIVEGRNGSHFQPLGTLCSLQNISQTGDGFGLSGSNGYIATAKAHASLAATQPDTTDNIRLHAKHVEIAMDNLKGWVATIDQDTLKLLQNTSDTSKVSEIVQLANQVLNGVDIDNDKHVDPIPGETGAITGYLHAQLMAALQLKPAA